MWLEGVQVPGKAPRNATAKVPGMSVHRDEENWAMQSVPAHPLWDAEALCLYFLPYSAPRGNGHSSDGESGDGDVGMMEAAGKIDGQIEEAEERVTKVKSINRLQPRVQGTGEGGLVGNKECRINRAWK